MISKLDPSKRFTAPDGNVFFEVVALPNGLCLAVRESDCGGGATVVNVVLIERT